MYTKILKNAMIINVKPFAQKQEYLLFQKFWICGIDYVRQLEF